jgi:transposase-like protein
MIDANSVSGTTRNFKNLIELRDHFSNEMVCIKHLEKMRWEKEGTYCPYCGHKKVYAFSDHKTYKCAKCRKRFNVKVGTIFENTKISLQEWFMAIYYLTAHKKGISSLQLGRDLGVTQKTAWFMMHRLRVSAISPEFDKPLQNTVEADEAYLGGKKINMHNSKKPKTKEHGGRMTLGKIIVFGMVQRNGYVRTNVISKVNQETLRNSLFANVKVGSRLVTDEFSSYSGLYEFYNHQTINFNWVKDVYSSQKCNSL